MLGVESRVVTAELLEAYKDQATLRALHRLIQSRNPQTLAPSCLPAGTEIYYYFKTSKQNVPIEWRTGIVVSQHPHFVTITTDRGRKTNISYEDIRIKPKNALTQELSQGYMEDYVQGSELEDREVDVQTTENINNDENNTAALMSSTTNALGADNADKGNIVSPEQQDIGSIAEKVQIMDNIDGVTLESQKQSLLENIKSKIGQRQVTSSELEFAPPWLLNDALQAELEANWNGAYIETPASTVDKNANVFSSHVVYKVKDGDDGQLKLKGRLVLHGNRDKDRFAVRRDSASADLSIVRLLLSLALILDFDIATADVKGAYMQSGPIKRELYVRPPKHIAHRNVLWKLLRLPYGIVEAGRQWFCAAENWLTTVYGLTRIHAVDQLFYKQGGDGRVVLFVAKVFDDFIIAGTKEMIDDFLEALHGRFRLGQANRGPEFKFL